jgi:hypothetical protein
VSDTACAQGRASKISDDRSKRCTSFVGGAKQFWKVVFHGKELTGRQLLSQNLAEEVDFEEGRKDIVVESRRDGETLIPAFIDNPGRRILKHLGLDSQLCSCPFKALAL